MIKYTNILDIPIVALDVASRLDTTGKICDLYNRASFPLTLVLPKSGLIKSEVKSYVGSRHLWISANLMCSIRN